MPFITRFIVLFFSTAFLLVGASGITHYRAGVAVRMSSIGREVGTTMTATAPATQGTGIGWD